MIELPRILVLSSAEESYATGVNDSFIAALNKQLEAEAVVEWHNYRDIRLEFGTNRIEAFIEFTHERLDSFKFVYFKSFFRYSEQAAAIAVYLDVAHIPFACSELRYYMPLTKLTQYARLAASGAPIAQTVYMDVSCYSGQFERLSSTLGVPFIFKSTDGSGGRENYLIHTEAELEAALAEYTSLQFVAQRYIENDSDLRVLIVDRQVQLVIRRQRAGDTHLNNTSQGGAARLMPLDELSNEHKALALQAAALMNREVAGVDLMFESGTNDPYILEVNASPQIGSGAFMDEKLAVYGNYFRNMLK